MLKETETEETKVFFVTFLSLVAFQLRGRQGPMAGYAYVPPRIPCIFRLVKYSMAKGFY